MQSFDAVKSQSLTAVFNQLRTVTVTPHRPRSPMSLGSYGIPSIVVSCIYFNSV